jgi:rhodanese-related sulfurtransferase
LTRPRSACGGKALIEHLRAGRQLVDTRLAEFVDQGTIPGAVAIAHTEIRDHLEGLDPERPVALFCNGPQCEATPDAVRQLLAAGRPPALILLLPRGDARLDDTRAAGRARLVPGTPEGQRLRRLAYLIVFLRPTPMGHFTAEESPPVSSRLLHCVATHEELHDPTEGAP